MRFVFGNCDLDTERYELRRAGQVVALEPQALRVLTYLLRHAERAVAKQELLQACWPGISKATFTEYALRNCLMKIRQAVGDAGTQRAVIETVRGYGYRWVVAVTVLSADASTVPPDHGSGTLPPAPRVPSQVFPGRRQLTVLRCALVEEPAWARRDPEEVQMVLQAFYTAGEEVMQRFAGYIAQYDSAGLLVYFGYPTADEAAAPRAVRAGLALVDALGHRTVRVAVDQHIRLAVRLGIHTGLMVVETPGTGRRQAPVALGDTPAVATHLQERAAPNTVIVSDATWRLVQDYFTGLALGLQALAGVAVPVPAYRVLGLSGVQHRLDVAPPHRLTPLVGREAELALLRAHWAQVQDGLGQVVVLNGEAGIGKSRLVRVLYESIAAEPHVRVEWRCAPEAQQSPFQPVITHVQRLLRWRPEEPPEGTLHTLEAMLTASGMALPEVVPLLAALLSLPLPASYSPLALTPQRQRHKTLETLLAWLLAESTRHPVLFIVEDVHWSDPSTLEFLTLLLDQGPLAHILTLLTCRPEFVPPWGFRAHCTSLTLNRLPQPQAIEMIERVAGGKVLPSAVIAQIAVQTDGVPLFVEELTKMVLESGLLHEDEDRDALTEPLSPLAIPATLHDSLMARLDRLGPVQAVAQLGATLGREFAYELFQAVSPWDEATVRQGLHQLVEAEFLYQRGLPPQATYRFKHAMIRDAAYQSLLKSTRQQYHQHIAQVLEARFPDLCATQPERLAHHYTEAGLYEQALSYWQQAGQRAVERSANAEAIQHFRHGLALLPTLPETPDRLQQELLLHIALATPLVALKGFGGAEVVQTYARAQDLCQQVRETPQLFPALWGGWLFHFTRGEHHTARARGEHLLGLAQRLQDSALLVESHFALGTSFFYLGEFPEARAHFDQELAVYDVQRHRALAYRYARDPGVAGLCLVAWALWALGYPDQAVEQGRQALARAQELAHAHTLCLALCIAASPQRRRGQEQVIQERSEAALTLAREQGFPFWEAWAMVQRGWVRATQGRDEAGLVDMRQGVDIWLGTGAEFGRPYFLTLLAEAYGAVGQPEAGLRAVAEGLTLVDTTGERAWETELHLLQGELLLLTRPRHTVVEAEESLLRALDTARRQQAKSLELRSAISLTRLWQRQGKRHHARDLLAPIYAWFAEGLDTTDLQEARALLEALEG
jgi:class 3 adenylate cyclase/predicted ATPase